ncbi:MAG: hypothetical protein ACM3QY_06190 [Candidatus Levyibacteriota bacterium]
MRRAHAARAAALALTLAWALAQAGASQAQSPPMGGSGAAAPSAAPALLGSVDVSSDTDGFHWTRLRAGGLFPYASYFDYAGLAVQDTRYSQAGWSRDAAGIVGLWRKQDPRTLAGVIAEAGVVQVAGHTRAVADATWSLRPAPDTGVELLAAGDVVTTQKAIERGVAYGFFGASVEHAFADRFTAIGLVAYQPFTDGNDRTQLRARLIWQVVPESGFNAELRWRGYRSSKSDVDGAYFNPDRYEQWVGGLTLRRHIGSWTLGGGVGAGRETVNSTDRHPVRMAELRAEGALDPALRLVFYALYNRSTGYVDAPDYSYRQAGVTLIHPF